MIFSSLHGILYQNLAELIVLTCGGGSQIDL
jgi:hypothetical protein